MEAIESFKQVPSLRLLGGERPGGGSCLGCRSECEVKGSEWGWRGPESREIQGIFCRSSPQHWQVCLASSVSSSRKEARELYFHSHPSGGCVLSSFCLPILRLALTSSQVTEPCLPLPGGTKAETRTRNGTQRPGLRLRENLALFPEPVRSSTHFAEGRVKAAGCRLFLARGLGLELRPLPAACWELRPCRP